MKYREYEVSRVCAIDFKPLLIEAIKETLQICKKYNISMSTRSGAADVSKFFYHYCLEKFCSSVKKCPSKFPKAIVIYPLTSQDPFSEKNLKKILKVLPVPWCECSSFDSPDVESAVIRSISKDKTNGSRTNAFANKYQLHAFLKNFKTTKIFSNGVVDLPNQQ